MKRLTQRVGGTTATPQPTVRRVTGSGRKHLAAIHAMHRSAVTIAIREAWAEQEAWTEQWSETAQDWVYAPPQEG